MGPISKGGKGRGKRGKGIEWEEGEGGGWEEGNGMEGTLKGSLTPHVPNPCSLAADSSFQCRSFGLCNQLVDSFLPPHVFVLSVFFSFISLFA